MSATTKAMSTAKGRPTNHRKRKSYFRHGSKNVSHIFYNSPATSATVDECPVPIKRPKLDVYEEVVRTSTKIQYQVPSKLRPARDQHHFGNISSEFQNTEASEGENMIVNLDRMDEVIKAFMIPHNERNSCTKPFPRTKIIKRQGLCIEIEVRCATCRFCTAQLPLYKQTKKGKRGPATGSLNDRLALSAMKTKVGGADISFILACLDVKPPSSSLLYEKINAAADKIVELNKETLVKNQEFLREVNRMKGIKNLVDIAVDGAFNNRPKEGCEAGTQSVVIATEQNTSRKLPIEITTANKLCPIPNCQHNDKKCKKTYSVEDSICSSEAKLTQKNLTKIESAGILTISSVTCDASAQVEKVIREHSTTVNRVIRQFTCFVHFMRTFGKKLRNLKLKGPVPGKDRDIFRKKLAASTRRRAYFEIVRIQKSSSTEEIFLEKASAAIQNIVPCFSNNHQNCQNTSAVCTAHLASYNPKFLPYGKHLNLCAEDKKSLETILQSSLSLARLRKVSRLLNQNKNENLHHRIFSYCLKHTLWSRNFDALCHSALHSDVYGTGFSCLLLGKALGILPSNMGPMLKHMMQRDYRSLYHRKIKSSPRYIMKRVQSRKLKSDRKLLQGSFYTSCQKDLEVEHAYGLNPIKN